MTLASRSRRSSVATKGPSKSSARPSARRTTSEMTTDHEEIRQWVEARGGHPAIVKGTGVLRIDFPGYSGQTTLKAIPWEEWFETFDDRNLNFLYQDRTAGGKISRFNKLVCRT